MSDAMDDLMNSLFLNRVPKSWARLAWPSLRSLQSWLHNWQQRIQQLNDWAANPLEVPKVVWLSGMINPQSFLTAIAQQTAQRNSLELDKLVIQTDVTKRAVEEVDASSRDGAFVSGFFLQGCRWDTASNQLDKSRPREMFWCVGRALTCLARLVAPLALRVTNFILSWCRVVCQPNARHQLQGGANGQARGQGHLPMPCVQDGAARSNLRVYGAAENESCAGSVEHGRRCTAAGRCWLGLVYFEMMSWLRVEKPRYWTFQVPPREAGTPESYERGQFGQAEKNTGAR